MTRVRFASAAWVAILLLVSACGGRSHPGSTPAVDQNTLTADQLHQRFFYTAYEAIEALRPNWLSHHATFAAVQVYVDDNHAGGVEMLRTVQKDLCNWRSVEVLEAKLAEESQQRPLAAKAG